MNIKYYVKVKLQKKLKTKKTKSTIWPYFFPTSTMCFKRNYFSECIRKLNYSFNKFPRAFLDARISIYTQYIKNELKIDKKNLTIYRQNIYGDTQLNKYNKIIYPNWWKRRMEYHNFMKKFCNKFRLNYSEGLDIFITKLINKII